MGNNTGAAEFSVIPDLIVTAKQLTNGVIPMGAVIVKQEIYDTFMTDDNPEYMLELPHGYTYSAHPIACAAALATLDIIDREQMVSRVKSIAPKFENKIHSLKNCKYIADIRNYGLAAGITLESAPGEPALRPYKVAMKCWEKGFYIRYGGDTIQLGLPFIVHEEEIDDLVNALGEAVNNLN
jgi:beta-alanine--pyruvate transaminase